MTRHIRDHDSVPRAFRIQAMAWSLFGIPPAAMIGTHIGAGTGAPMFVTFICAAAGFTIVYFGSLGIGAMLGGAAGGVYFAAGASTAGSREYSLADSLIARGRIDEAIAELESASALYADDPEPPLRLARLLRDRCSRPHDAVRWFRTATARARGDAAVEIGALRETIEVYTHVLRMPRGALPDLARLASRHPDSAAGVWAHTELLEMKQAMQEEEQA